jgi:hypothetical protein
LVAGDAGAAIGADGFEEGMSAGAKGTIGEGHAEKTGRVFVVTIPGKKFVLVWLPPEMAGVIRITLGQGR